MYYVEIRKSEIAYLGVFRAKVISFCEKNYTFLAIKPSRGAIFGIFQFQGVTLPMKYFECAIFVSFNENRLSKLALSGFSSLKFRNFY